MSEYIYGIHAVNALLQFNPGLIERLVVQSGRDDAPLKACVARAHALGFDAQKKSRVDIDRLFKAPVVHQGVVAFCKGLPSYNESDIETILEATQAPYRILVLDGVQDPHNLGACLRVANAFGVCCVIAPKDRSAPLNATAIKVSCGAAFATPFVQVTNLARAITKLQNLGIWFVGAAATAESAFSDIDMSGNIAIVMGAEGQGLRALTQKHCDYLAKIPMQGSVESLNVSVATGVALYEVMRSSST